MSEQLAIGTRVVTRLEIPGIEQNGIVYGWLPRLARGNVVAHTQDGRAVIDFPGHGAHTWNDPALLDVIEVVPDELAWLRAELTAANERVAQLEAAQVWEPVETAELACACGNCSVPLTVDGDMLELENDTDYFQFVLPDGYRLMRRRPRGERQEES